MLECWLALQACCHDPNGDECNGAKDRAEYVLDHAIAFPALFAWYP
tara:strand:+ start:670 stop:807 length:138 start_codon:yes stop_codon:yes gene_type:complete